MPSKKRSQPKNFHDRNGRYWARLGVPKALRSIVGKGELWEALGSDFVAAKRRHPAAIGRMQEQLDEARAQLEITQKRRSAQPRSRSIQNVRNLAKAHFESELDKHEASRRADRSRFAETIRYENDLALPYYADQLRIVVNGLASNEEANALIGWAIDDFRERGNTTAKFGTPEWRELAQALAGVHLEAMRLKNANDAGDFTAEPQHPLLTKAPTKDDPLKARIIGPDSERLIGEVAEQFAREKSTGDRTRHDNRVTIRMLEEHIGEPLPIYRLTRQHIHSFKRALAAAPANYTKRFDGMSLPEAIEANKAKARPFPLLNARTINDKYLARLHAFLNWAVRNDIIPDNPAAGIKVEAARDAAPPRVNFSPADLTALFGEQFPARSEWGEREWAMVLSLFTGMRASELAQVRLDSIRTERGILIIAVEEQTKNRGSQRIIPVHSKLKALGFENHVAKLRRQKQTHLFPVWYGEGMEAKAKASTSNATVDHYFPRYLPRRFNVTYLKNAGISDSRKSWHSFRHTFKTGLALAGIGKDMRDQLCGHSDKSAGAVYVHGGSVEAMRAAIEKLRFDGFGLTGRSK